MTERTVLGSPSSFWNSPCNILRGHFDITELAVDAVLVLINDMQGKSVGRAYLRVDDQFFASPPFLTCAFVSNLRFHPTQ
jgi:hypothetical protein